MRNSSLSFVIIIIITGHCFGQKIEKENPLSFGTTYVGDILGNVDGGIKQGSTYMGMANLTMHFDTKKAKLWKGGEFFINASHTHGGEATANLIGDFQTASNIEAGNLTYMHEMWYKQSFKNVSITIGLQDLNADFVAIDFGGGLINSSFGIPSTFAYNIPSAIFPNTEYGVSINWDLNEIISFQSSIFKCDGGDFEKNPYNIKSDFNRDKNYQLFNEFHINKSLINNNSGIFKFGTYYHKDHDVEDSHSNNYGFYFLGEQVIFEQNQGNSSLGIFTQASFSPNDYCDNPLYLGFGFNYKGLIKQRINDELSFGVGYSKINNQAVADETVFELNYNVQLTENISIKPDLQYIINPAGYDTKLDNALVTTIRFELSF